MIKTIIKMLNVLKGVEFASGKKVMQFKARGIDGKVELTALFTDGTSYKAMEEI